MPGDMNLPYEPVPDGPFQLPPEPGVLSGGVTVGALVIGDPDGEHLPAIMFRFAYADGSGFHPPIVLGCDRVEDLQALPELVRQAVEAAVKASA